MKYIFGDHEANTLAQFEDVSSRATHSVLCADGHFGYIMPVGATCAYRNKVSVAGVGFDIGCGNAAIRTNLRREQFSIPQLHELANEIFNTISFGIGRKNTADLPPVDHPLFSDPAWEGIPASTGERVKLWAKANAQLGTVGGGNHYVDVFSDTDGRLWVGVHFGSRGFGHTIASGFLSIVQGGEWGDKVPETETLLGLDTPIGDAYWSLMTLAGEYAYAGREWVARRVVNIMGGVEEELIHNNHNFAWKETHNNEEFVVVRKGATPAFPGQKGFVGGSMGDVSVIIQGQESDTARTALYSTVHGAGRVMGRQDAIRGKKIVDENGGVVGRDTSTIVTRDMQRDWLDGMGVILRGGGVDESPHVYRRLPSVLETQGDSIQIIETLHPLIVCMADKNTKDPYKD